MTAEKESKFIKIGGVRKKEKKDGTSYLSGPLAKQWTGRDGNVRPGFSADLLRKVFDNPQNYSIFIFKVNPTTKKSPFAPDFEVCIGDKPKPPRQKGDKEEAGDLF